MKLEIIWQRVNIFPIIVWQYVIMYWAWEIFGELITEFNVIFFTMTTTATTIQVDTNQSIMSTETNPKSMNKFRFESGRLNQTVLGFRYMDTVHFFFGTVVQKKKKKPII